MFETGQLLTKPATRKFSDFTDSGQSTTKTFARKQALFFQSQYDMAKRAKG
jgi:hypothetical protein